MPIPLPVRFVTAFENVFRTVLPTVATFLAAIREEVDVPLRDENLRFVHGLSLPFSGPFYVLGKPLEPAGVPRRPPGSLLCIVHRDHSS